MMLRLCLSFLLISTFCWGESSFSSESGDVVLDAGGDGLNEIRITSDGQLNIGASSQGNLLNVSGNLKASAEVYAEQLHLENGMTTAIQVVSSNSTITGTPLVFADSSSQDITLTLPSATEGLNLHIKKTAAANHVILDAGVGVLIGDTQNITLSGNIGLGHVQLLAVDGNWEILSSQGLE